MRPVIVVIALFACATIAANASAVRPAKPCGVYSVRAVVGGRARCLRDEQPCRHRFERQYQRYDFHCRNDSSLVATWRRLGRPLKVPSIASGIACPVSDPETRINFSDAYGVGRGIGPGPSIPSTTTRTDRRRAPSGFDSRRLPAPSPREANGPGGSMFGLFAPRTKGQC